jgi:hypothetical protein
VACNNNLTKINLGELKMKVSKNKARMTPRLVIGEKLWNGVIVNNYIAEQYNRIQERIESFYDEGLKPPEYLLDASHKILRDAI